MTSVFQPGFGVPGSGDVNQMHQYDDADVSFLSHHHTLGMAPGQASAGDHVHDNKTSKRLLVIDSADSDFGAYTPVVASGPGGATAINALGNGSAAGRFVKVGQLVYFNAKITIGSTTTFNAGQPFEVTLPDLYQALDNISRGGLDSLVQARLLDTSAGQSYFGGGIISVNSDLGSVFRFSFGGPAGSMTPTVPITLAVNDVLHVTGTYETGFIV